MDPQLLANLTRLGPVKVDHGMRGLKLTGVPTSRILNAQKRSETEAQTGETKRNHLQAPLLSNALARFQEVRDERMVGRLAGEYNLDAGVLRELGKTVNVPTPDETTARTIVDEGGAEVVLKTVRLVRVCADLTYALFSRRNGLPPRPSRGDALRNVITRKTSDAFGLEEGAFCSPGRNSRIGGLTPVAPPYERNTRDAERLFPVVTIEYTSLRE